MTSLDIGEAPVFTKEEEITIANRMINNNDQFARDELIRSQMPMAISVAGKYLKYRLPLEDLTQEACMGAIKAVDKFDPTKGARLATYSRDWMRSEIHRYIGINLKIVRPSMSNNNNKLFIHLPKFKKNGEWLNKQEIREISKSLNVSEKDVVEMEGAMYSSGHSLDSVSDDGLSIGNALVDKQPTPDQMAQHYIDSIENHRLLVNGIHALSDRDRDIMTSRHLLEEPISMDNIKEKHGISYEAIRKINLRSIEKLKKAIL